MNQGNTMTKTHTTRRRLLQGAGLGANLRTELDALWTAITAHVHPGVTAGAAATGLATYASSKQTVESSIVKVKP